MTLNLIVFIVLALFIGVCSVLAVTTGRILRAATYLLFVLFGTAGIYFQLHYSFLGAVQLLIYAGGITVLYVFSILLTSSQGDKAEPLKSGMFVTKKAITLTYYTTDSSYYNGIYASDHFGYYAEFTVEYPADGLDNGWDVELSDNPEEWLDVKKDEEGKSFGDLILIRR